MLCIDYIKRAPFFLETNEERFERKSLLTRQLKNAALQVLFDYRRTKSQPKFVDILNDILVKKKQEIKLKKKNLFELMFKANMEDGEDKKASHEAIYLSDDQVKDIWKFLDQVEKAVFF